MTEKYMCVGDFKQGQLNNNGAWVALKGTKEYWLIKISWEYLESAPSLILQSRILPRNRAWDMATKGEGLRELQSTPNLGLLYVTIPRENIIFSIDIPRNNRINPK